MKMALRSFPTTALFWCPTVIKWALMKTGEVMTHRLDDLHPCPVDHGWAQEGDLIGKSVSQDARGRDHRWYRSPALNLLNHHECSPRRRHGLCPRVTCGTFHSSVCVIALAIKRQ